MYRRYTRRLNDREREKLREFSQVPDGLTLIDLVWRFAGLAIGVGVILVPVVTKGGSPLLYPPLALLALAVVGMSLYKYFHDQQAQVELDDREQRILADAQVEVEQFQVHRAIELDTGRGEGAMFVLELGDGRVAFLSGLYLAHTDDHLPSTEFELVVTRCDEVWLGIFSTGEELESPLERAPRGFPPNDFDELVFVRGSLRDPLPELCRRAVEEPQPETSEPRA